MSDNPQASPDHSSSPDPKSGGGGHKVLFILLGIIAVVLAAFCYDTFVVPGTVQAGFDKIADAQLKSLADEKTLSKEAVREVLGKEPSETYEKGEEYFEVFHWTGGMIVNSHKLYTVYRKQGEDWVFDHHSLAPREVIAKATTVVEAPAVETDPNYSSEPSSGPDENGESDGAERPAMEDEDQPESDSETASPEEDESQN